MESLTAEQIDQVRRDYIAYRKAHNIIDSHCARQVGYSASVVSQWWRGVYDKGDVEAVTRRVNDWMEQDARARKAALPIDYVKTEVAEGMRSIAMTAQTTASMAAMVVPSGCGKTMVLKILSDKLGGRYMYCSELMTPKSFLMALAKAIDLPAFGKSSATIQEAIVDKLNGTNRPILLDEAHRLPLKVFSVIRTIHDLSGVAVIMAGTHEILDKITDTSNSRGQMSSRCLRYTIIDRIFDVDRGDSGGDGGAKLMRGKALFTKKEIEALFAKSDVKFDADAFQFVWAVACLPNHGCLRTARRIVQLVRQHYPEETISRERLIWALGLLFDTAGNHIADSADKHCQQLGRRVA